MILVGQYDSPFVRRVAISLRLLDIAHERDTRSVFGDFDAMRTVNPLGRIPSLVLDDGETLIESAAILDHLDSLVGPTRALTPQSGSARREALRRIALASGVIEKFGAVNYERLIRPEALRWGAWIDRCAVQARGGLAALERLEWPDRLDQARITTACAVNYVRTTQPDEMPPGAFPTLTRLADACEALPSFVATHPGDLYAVPRG